MSKKVTFFIKTSDGAIDYYTTEDTPEKYDALEAYLSEHFRLSELTDAEVFEATQLSVSVSIQPI